LRQGILGYKIIRTGEAIAREFWNFSMKILVRFPNWLGDLVMSIGFYNKLKEIFRDGKVFAIVRSEVGELLNLFGDFERIFYFSKDKYKGILGIIRFSKGIRNNYDIYFSLPNSFSSALMGFFSNSKKKNWL
jgi:ADP-heptose:LPS heptosyltransferase